MINQLSQLWGQSKTQWRIAANTRATGFALSFIAGRNYVGDISLSRFHMNIYRNKPGMFEDECKIRPSYILHFVMCSLLRNHSVITATRWCDAFSVTLRQLNNRMQSGARIDLLAWRSRAHTRHEASSSTLSYPPWAVATSGLWAGLSSIYPHTSNPS